MKRSLFLAAVTAAAIPSAARAIDTLAGPYAIRIAGLGASMGTAELVALGVVGEDCRYLMTWESPFNPNEVELCDVRERRTPLSPACIDNRFKNFTTFVHAGPASPAATACAGFDNLGEAFDGVSLLLGESPTSLEGALLLPWGPAYPVEITGRPPLRRAGWPFGRRPHP